MLTVSVGARRRALTLVLAGCALAVAPAVAGAATGPSVSGGGQNNPGGGDPINHFAINAKSDSLGNAFGEVHWTDTISGPPINKFQGSVVCVRAVSQNPFLGGGPVATVVMMIDKTKEPPGFQPDADLMWIQDNGPPTGGQPKDIVRNDEFNSAVDPELLSCPNPASAAVAATLAPVAPLSSGNIVINNAQ